MIVLLLLLVMMIVLVMVVRMIELMQGDDGMLPTHNSSHTDKLKGKRERERLHEMPKC